MQDDERVHRGAQEGRPPESRLGSLHRGGAPRDVLWRLEGIPEHLLTAAQLREKLLLAVTEGGGGFTEM